MRVNLHFGLFYLFTIYSLGSTYKNEFLFFILIFPRSKFKKLSSVVLKLCMKKHFTHFVSWEYFYGKVYITLNLQRVGKSPRAISTKSIILKVNAEHVNAIISFAM